MFFEAISWRFYRIFNWVFLKGEKVLHVSEENWFLPFQRLLNKNFSQINFSFKDDIYDLLTVKAKFRPAKFKQRSAKINFPIFSLRNFLPRNRIYKKVQGRSLFSFSWTKTFVFRLTVKLSNRLTVKIVRVRRECK